MQDPTFTAAAAAFPQLKVAQFPEHEQLRCPRCDSANTKFCYYNNYNLSQPRHFCKNCRRYWTKGGALRNIPVGGGSRKNSKRAAAATKQQQQRAIQNPNPGSVLTTTTTTSPSGSGSMPSNRDQNPRLKSEPNLGAQITIGAESGSGLPTGSGVTFTSLLGLASEGHFGNLLGGLGQTESKDGASDGSGQNPGLDVLQGSSVSSEGFMINGLQLGSDANCWGSSNGWPDLAIYAPGSDKF